MNIHPFIVHFPIALLILYSIMEFLDFKQLKNNDTFFFIKGTFLILGTIGAFLALGSGDLASEQYTNTSLSNIIETHEMWASITTTIFGILTFLYLIHLGEIGFPYFLKEIIKKKKYTKVIIFLLKIKQTILFTKIKYFIVIMGLVAIVVTGALGGALTYGPDIDPVVSLIYYFFN